jgi:hypothetical protein
VLRAVARIIAVDVVPDGRVRILKIIRAGKRVVRVVLTAVRPAVAAAFPTAHKSARNVFLENQERADDQRDDEHVFDGGLRFGLVSFEHPL